MNELILMAVGWFAVAIWFVNVITNDPYAMEDLADAIQDWRDRKNYKGAHFK